MKTSIVIPAHNEAENLPELLSQLSKIISKIDAEIVIVDDNSTDSTPQLADNLSREYKNVLVVHRRGGERGMGAALKEGTRASRGEVVVWTMADLTDDLTTIPMFLEKIQNGADMVFGSRYVSGGSSGNLTWHKAFFSRNFTKLSKFLIGVPVHDITNAFRAFRKEVFDRVQPTSSDFAISPEFALKAHVAGFKLAEVPTVYRDRTRGQTKFRMFHMGRRYFSTLMSAFFLRMKGGIRAGR